MKSEHTTEGFNLVNIGNVNAVTCTLANQRENDSKFAIDSFPETPVDRAMSFADEIWASSGR